MYSIRRYLALICAGLLFNTCVYLLSHSVDAIQFGQNPLLLKRQDSNGTMHFELLSNYTCREDSECGNGVCKVEPLANSSYCRCDDGYINAAAICDYEQKSELIAFLLSFFIGTLGADFFYLAYGNGCYICAGVAKLLTLGCCGIWWIVDVVRILCDVFPDGNGQALQPW